MSAPSFIPYARQTVEEADIDAVAAVLRSDWLTTGPRVTGLEAAFAAEVAASHAITCSSGTAALHLACLAAELGPGDTAIVPSITFLATANTVRMTGAEVIFADVAADTGMMEASHLAEAWQRAERGGHRVKAVLPVHLAGQSPDLAAIAAFARSRGALIIEDACHALGSRSDLANGGTTATGSGQHSDLTAFSLHPTKTVAAGEGGIVTTNDPGYAVRVQRLRNHGINRDAAGFERPELGLNSHGTPNPWYYEMAEFGWNYRLSDLHAALALSQLGRLDTLIATRRHLADLYDKLLRPHHALLQPLRRKAGCRPAWHLYPVLIDFDTLGHERSDVMARLSAAGIGTQVHYIPVHEQPYYRDRYGDLSLPGAALYYRRTLSLPLFVGLRDEDIYRVVETLVTTLQKAAATQTLPGRQPGPVIRALKVGSR